MANSIEPVEDEVQMKIPDNNSRYLSNSRKPEADIAKLNSQTKHKEQLDLSRHTDWEEENSVNSEHNDVDESKKLATMMKRKTSRLDESTAKKSGDASHDPVK